MATQNKATKAATTNNQATETRVATAATIGTLACDYSKHLGNAQVAKEQLERLIKGLKGYKFAAQRGKDPVASAFWDSVNKRRLADGATVEGAAKTASNYLTAFKAAVEAGKAPSDWNKARDKVAAPADSKTSKAASHKTDMEKFTAQLSGVTKNPLWSDATKGLRSFLSDAEWDALQEAVEALTAKK